MEILYVVKPTPLIIFIIAAGDQVNTDFSFFFLFSHVGDCDVQLQ